VLSPNLFNNDHSYLAATDGARLSDFQAMLNDPTIAAIVFARGGYGTTRILDYLDLQPLVRDPKWIVGFSDATALHLKLNSIGLESIHSTMPVFFSKADSSLSVDSLRQLLFGVTLPITAPANTKNRLGFSTGRVVGGNLSLVLDSFSTSSEPQLKDKILVVEDIDEHLYRIDRMFTQLRRSGKLAGLRGLVIGHFSDLKDTSPRFGESLEEIILNKVGQFEYPIGFNFPIGHENPNLAWRCGSIMNLTVDQNGSSLVSPPATAG
jgi:muramoyltetrapeptide carboxypeptidase